MQPPSPEPPAARPPPIGHCAIIGDGRSAALVSTEGAIEWLCWPRFDAPSLFASLLDCDRGGTFRIRPHGPAKVTRRYIPETNVLETRFEQAGGTLLLTDFMPVWSEERPTCLAAENQLLRRAECVQGEILLDVRFDPRPGYGTEKVRLKNRRSLGWSLDTRNGAVHLRAQIPLEPHPAGGLVACHPMRAGEVVDFGLTNSLEPAVLPGLGHCTTDALHRTIRLWRAWSRRTRYDGPWRDAVVRSALVLKLLAFAPTGAIVAAPTTSLPERPGADLNWDYRYCWLRDASLTARALFGLGHHDEAHAFLGWTLHATRLTRPRLQVLYDLYGRKPVGEHNLDHFEGWRGARPVRVGNAAHDQRQLDVYGEVIDAAAWLARHGGGFDRQTAGMLEDFGRWVRAHWTEPDDGIWELRTGPRPYTHSRVLAWTAMDRLVALHDAGLLSLSDRTGYVRARERIRDDVERRGFHPEEGAYTATLCGSELDAALLLLPHYGYQPAHSARMRSTVHAIRHGLGTGGPLVRRSPRIAEGAFGICSFWLIECLALGASNFEDAERSFEQMLSYANDVGLFGEEIDPTTGEALGNFPQAFTHIGLVNAALTLEEVRERALPRPQVHHASMRSEPYVEAPP